MGNTIVRKYALGSLSDLKSTSTSQHDAYKLGDTVEVFDYDDEIITTYMYVNAGNALTQYGAYLINHIGVAGTEVQAISIPNAALTVYSLICVPQVAFASGEYGWVAIKGACSVLSTGNTTVDHFGAAVKNINTVTDEASLTVNSVLTYKATQSEGAATVAAYLIGNKVTIAA